MRLDSAALAILHTIFGMGLVTFGGLLDVDNNHLFEAPTIFYAVA
jgi:hypothetical protein